MCDLVTLGIGAAIAGIAGTGISAYSQYKQGQATQTANYMQAQIYDYNSDIALQNAATERQIGYDEARKRRIQAISNMGSQKAAMAASGIDINQGSAVDLVADTAAFGELDALTELYNSERGAVNYERQATDFRNQATLSRMSGKNAYTSGIISGLGTGLTGVSQVAGRWTTYGNAGLKSGV
jgi:hypothetical protein